MFRLACLCVFFGLLTGCPTRTVVRGEPKDDASREAMLAKILQQRAPLRSLEGSAKLRLTEPGKRRSTYRLFYMMKRPNMLYLELTAALQQPGAIITSDGKRFAFHNLLQKEFLRGPAEGLPRLLQAYLPANLPLADLIHALLGDPPVLQGASRKWSKEKSLWMLVVQKKQQKQTVWIDFATQQIVRVMYDRPKKPTLTLEYSGFRGTPALPRRVRFSLRSRGFKADWIFLEQKRNTEIPAKNFRQKVPQGVPVRELLAATP
ncbi:MAG: DUF4292 domain-containing protein [Myxococcales bacterium]|nr:DUF4292 domain-containing protein [Myxococcales bacterium]